MEHSTKLQSPRYNWNIVQSSVKYHHPNLPLIYNMIEIPQRHDTTEIVLNVALHTITVTLPLIYNIMEIPQKLYICGDWNYSELRTIFYFFNGRCYRHMLAFSFTLILYKYAKKQKWKAIFI
jgi:hypothetical protein